MDNEIGVVVPTLGTRNAFLRLSLESLRKAGVNNIVVVAPDHVDLDWIRSQNLADTVVTDSGNGLPAAINAGFGALPDHVKFLSWLGDDDLVHALGFAKGAEMLRSDESVVLTYGSCEYINSGGQRVWMNTSGQWASWILRFGPCLIPQPGSLIRRSCLNKVGGLDETLGWVFDLDLFLRLRRIGKLKYLNVSCGSFRWHQDSLSVAGRARSVNEASMVRQSYLPLPLRWICGLWEFPVRRMTFHAKRLVRE
jgi:hypothetical protein